MKFSGRMDLTKDGKKFSEKYFVEMLSNFLDRENVESYIHFLSNKIWYRISDPDITLYLIS
jgi:hypothetical protein